jgi:PLP dependent protein
MFESPSTALSKLEFRRLQRPLYDRVLALESNFQSRLQAVETRIQRALDSSGRKRSDVTLVAVSKKFSAATIREAYQAGIRDFGENYVQEFASKRPRMQDLVDARFHLIGHLQSNKARLACELFQVIQTADSAKLLQRLDTAAGERNSALEVMLEVMLEVKLSPEGGKTGARPEDLPALLDAASRAKHLRLSGLMTMPPWSEDPENSRPYFQKLAQLARQFGLPNLSMGMSNDFEAAIQEGATLIRVGTALFGPRPKSENVSPSLAS